MNILIIGDKSSKNLGDPILTISAKYLVQKIVIDENIEYRNIEIIDLADRRQDNNITRKSANFGPNNIKEKIKDLRMLKNIKVLINWFLRYRRIFQNKFNGKITNNTIIIIAGGALFSNLLYYSLRINEICSLANKFKAKIIFNAIGVEYNKHKTLNYYITKRFLKMPCVVSVSTRDNTEYMKQLVDNKAVKLVADPAIWSSEAFKVKKNEKSGIVGIGVISANAYKSVYNAEKSLTKKIDEEEILEFWESVISELNKNNIRWKIFTNGGEADNALAEKLVERCGYDRHDTNYLLPPPKSPEILVNNIKQFDVVVAHRLHALVVATSLEIPIIPILWSNKVKNFAARIGRGSLVFLPKKRNVNFIIENINYSMCYNSSEITKIKDVNIKFKEESYMFLLNQLKTLEKKLLQER